MLPVRQPRFERDRALLRDRGAELCPQATSSASARADALASPTTLASAQSHPFRIAVDATSVYWTNSANPNGTVMTCVTGARATT